MGVDTGQLEEETGYRAARTAYSVRFFPEVKDGERRPDNLKGKRGVTEGWEEVMPLELAFYLSMVSRIAGGILKGKGRTEGMETFSSARTVAEVRAIASCLWIEKQAGFPFKSIKKTWKVGEILDISSDLESANRRHAAIMAQPDRLKARGVYISEGQCGINFAKLGDGSLGRLPIPGLVDKVSIPLGILARLDECELQTPEDVVKWFSSFLHMPRITHEFLASLSERLIPLGVSLTSSRFRIDQGTFDLDGIKRITLPDVIPGCGLTFGDFARMTGCALEDEESLTKLFDKHSYVPSTRIHRDIRGHGLGKVRAAISRAIGQIVDGEDEWTEIDGALSPHAGKPKRKQEEVEERGLTASFDHYRRRLESMRIAPAREAEIVESIRQGSPFDSFRDEIASGYQVVMLNWVLGFGVRVHHGNEEDIKEILSEANLNFTNRSGNFSLRDGINNPIRQFVFSCVFGAVQEAVRSGLLNGIKMTSPADRTVLGHHNLVLEALKVSPNTGNEDQITINLPQTKKYPEGRQSIFKRSDLEIGLLKLRMIQCSSQSGRGDEENGDTYLIERDAVDGRAPGVDLGLRDRRRTELLIRFQEILTRGIGNQRHIALLVNEMRLRLGLADGITKDELATGMGVTPARISQLVHNEGAIQRRLNELFGPGLRRHFTDEEIMILIGRDQGIGVEDYL